MKLSPIQLKYFADFIEKELGITYSETNYFQLEQRLDKIALYLGLKTGEEVYQKAQKEGIFGDFKQYLLDIATNNETSFFRDPKVFLNIENVLLPSLKKDFPNAFSYRVWCAAASFGQEPYSVAMLVHEFLKKNPGHPRIEVTATDISDQALKRCQEARYSQLEIQRGLSASRMVQYFKKNEENQWELIPEVKNLVQFKKQNLLEPFLGLGTFNIILCRYVLIYQTPERKKAIVEKIERTLTQNGYLILGASESAMGLTVGLSQTAHDGVIAYQKK